VEYKGLPLDCGYRLELIVREQAVVELKCVEKKSCLFMKRSYFLNMRLPRSTVNLLINFKVSQLTQGTIRTVLSFVLVFLWASVVK